MLKCNSYKYRLPGAGITVLLPLRKDGLFPGQLPPPREAYDNSSDPEPDTTIDEECST